MSQLEEEIGSDLPEAARILQFSNDVEQEIDLMSQELLTEIAFPTAEAASDDEADTECRALDDDIMAILNEFAKTSDLEALKSQLPRRSILDSLKKEMHNDNEQAMKNYLNIASESGIDSIAIDSVSASKQGPSNVKFFESPVFGSGDIGDSADDILASFDTNITRLMSDPIHGEMTSANLMKNWIQEDEDEDVELIVHSDGLENQFSDSFALDGAVADRSPIDDIVVKFPSTPCAAGTVAESPLSQAPALPMMLRQEARPGRKASMGKLTQETVTPSTGQPSHPLNLTPPPAAAHSPISKMDPVGIFSPSKDRLVPAADAATTPDRSVAPNKSDSSPMGPQVVDSSVLGDYCHWTAGPRLSATGMRQLYSGLFATALDEAEAGMAGKMADENSVGQGNGSASSGVGAVGTAVALLPMLLGGMKNKQSVISPVHKANHRDREEVSISQPTADTTSHGKQHTSVRSVRVLEIVSRPDIPLKEIMTMCYKASRASVLRCTMSQNCHMILETAQIEGTKAQEPYTGKGGWNTIDIQVCISKELRQRVVVLQFLYVESETNGKATPLVRRSPAQYQQFLVNIQRLFTTGNISLSGLYKQPVKDAIIHSLDSQFIEQLRNVCREDMWSVLRNQISEMDVQINEAEQVCSVLQGLIEPIYRQHGIDLGVLEELKSQANPSDDASAPNSSVTEIDEVDPPLEERKAGMEGCLLLLEYHKRRFQRRYDRELTQRLRKRLATTISICEKLGDYRRSMLRTLAEHPLAKTSSLAKAFGAAFDGLEVTSSVESEHLYIKYNAISDADLGSNSSGSSGSDAIDKETYVNIGGNHSPEKGGGNSNLKPKLKPSPFAKPRGDSADDDDDDMFTPTKTSRGADDSDNMDKTFISPPSLPATAPTTSTSKTLGSSVASITSAAKGGIMNWWYGGSAPTENTSTDLSDGDSDIVVVEETKKKTFSFYVIAHREVVLYCCACFVSTMPGYMYLTPSLLCLAARIPGISKVHEAYHLADIQEVLVQSNKGTYSAMPYTCSITIFKASDPMRKELFITPAVVDCKLLKVIMDETRDMLLR